MIDVCLLGTAGTVPLPERHLASALVRHAGRLVLIDCGEGTQVAMRKAGWGFGGLETILLTHVHADHVAGLPGLLLTLSMSGRTAPLEIVGPKWMIEVMQAFRVLVPALPYELQVEEIGGGHEREVAGLTLRSLELDHRLPTLAYRFDLGRAPLFLADRADHLGVPRSLRGALQSGQSVSWPGGSATPADVLGPPRPGVSVAYVTDTRPVPGLADFVRDVDLLVCEAMYFDPVDLPKAVENKHLHFSETAELVKEAGVRQVWLTHYSQSVVDPSIHADAVRAACPVVEIGRDGMSVTLRFRDP